MRIDQILLAMCSLFPLTGLQAQNENAETKKAAKILAADELLPRATIKFNVTTLLIDPKRSIFLASDIRISKLMSIDVGVGAYLNSWAYCQYNDETFSGLRTRLGAKYYLSVKSRSAFYLGMEILYNHSFADQYYDVHKPGTMLNNGSRFKNEYTEKMILTTEMTNGGISVRTGVHVFTGSKKQFFFDFFGGLGVKVTNKVRSEPSNATSVSRDKQFDGLDAIGIQYDREPGHYVNTHVSLGLYFGYCFRKSSTPQR